MRPRWCVAASIVALLALAASSAAGPPGQWTRLPGTVINFAEPGLARTPDGVLHVLYTRRNGSRLRRTIQVPPDPQALEQMAAATDGEFFTALDDEELSQVYEELGSRLGEREELREITDVFAAGGVLLLLAGGALSAFLFRRVP